MLPPIPTTMKLRGAQLADCDASDFFGTRVVPVRSLAQFGRSGRHELGVTASLRGLPPALPP